jgi:lipopolysaccharide transport system ATP-binding protein
MGEVTKGGRTVLFVSHNMNAIERLCTCALLLDEGFMKRFTQDVPSLVKEYLFERDALIASSEWINSGNRFENPWFKPLRFFISDEHGNKQDMPVRNDSKIWVQIEAEIAQMDPALTIGYAIYAEDGTLLYWSYQTDESEDKWPKLKKGVCILRSRIPERFLNEGSYRIELLGSLHFRQWLLEPGVNAPSIHLTIQGGLSDSALWIMRRPGLIAPVIEWNIVK